MKIKIIIHINHLNMHKLFIKTHNNNLFLSINIQKNILELILKVIAGFKKRSFVIRVRKVQ